MTLDSVISSIHKSLSIAKKPVMFFDSDTDGTTSYLQLKRVFPKLIGYPFARDQEKQKECIRYLEEDTDTVFFIDIPVVRADLLELIKDKKIIWADHHILQDKSVLSNYTITYLNPLDFDAKDNRPSCYLAYKIAGSKDNLDLLSLGSISDFYLLPELAEWEQAQPNQFNSVLRLSESKKSELFSFLKKNNFNEATVREERENWIRYLTYECGVSELKNFFDFIYKVDSEARMLHAVRMVEKLSLTELLGEIRSGKGFLFEDYAKLTSKYRKIFDKAMTQVKDEKIVFFEYTGLRAYTKTLSEELCYRLKNWEVIAVFFKKKSGHEYQGSTRAKSDVHLPNLLKECLVGLEGYGGGHPKASGCKVSEKDFPEFKKRFISKLSA